MTRRESSSNSTNDKNKAILLEKQDLENLYKAYIKGRYKLSFLNEIRLNPGVVRLKKLLDKADETIDAFDVLSSLGDSSHMSERARSIAYNGVLDLSRAIRMSRLKKK